MKQHIKTHRIELMQDQKPGFTVGKKGRPAAILSHDLGPGLDMANWASLGRAETKQDNTLNVFWLMEIIQQDGNM